MKEHVVNNAVLVFITISVVITLVQGVCNLLTLNDKQEIEAIDMVNLAANVAKFILLVLTAACLSEILPLGP